MIIVKTFTSSKFVVKQIISSLKVKFLLRKWFRYVFPKIENCLNGRNRRVILDYWIEPFYKEGSLKNLEVSCNRCHLLTSERKLILLGKCRNFFLDTLNCKILFGTVFSTHLNRIRTMVSTGLKHYCSFHIVIYLCWFMNVLQQVKWNFFYGNNLCMYS